MRLQVLGGRPVAEAFAEDAARTDARSGHAGFAPSQEFMAREGVAASDAPGDLELAGAVASLTREYGLSEREAQVVYLRSQFPKWKHREIADRLGIDEDTSKQHLHRARRKLKPAV